jgi:hypothetical protein
MTTEYAFAASPRPWDALRPDDDCPKCGMERAFRGDPIYIKEQDYRDSRDDWHVGSEELAWYCVTCRYAMSTRTLDAR